MNTEKQEQFEVKSSLAAKIDYKKELNQQQYDAVTTEGPALVIAGAGSGKTRVLVYRVAYLIENAIDPREILLLTFTKKAANEMMDRVSMLLKNKSGGSISGGTFHSFANSILRQYANLLDIPVNFSILDNADSEDVIDKIRTELGYCNSKIAFPKKGRLFEIISSSRNRVIAIEEVIQSEFTGLVKQLPDIEKISAQYANYKKTNGLFDFDDLMGFLAEKLKSDPYFREMVRRKYKYVMVDEYQDTNILQNEIVRLIAPTGDNIMVVGDDMQSIYAFRGANYENIIQYPKVFAGCKVIKLEQNYRSQPALLDFTNATIQNAPVGFKKKLWSEKLPGDKPKVIEFYDAQEEAEFVVDKILELSENNLPMDQLAVLTRASWNSNFVQLELEKRGIPYVVVGGLKFTERKHVKDILAYLKIAHNPKDVVAWHRVLKLLPGVGSKTADKIISETNSVKNIKVEELKQLLIEIATDEISLPDKIEKVKKHYYPIMEAIDCDAELRKMDIEMIQERAIAYETLEKFLSDFILNPPSKKMAKTIAPLIDETEEKPVTVSTIHSAKGLEWHTLFLIHAMEGIIPSVKAISDVEVEEERRLFYVACTRAKENLYITYPSFLPKYDGYFHKPSRFVEEINENKYLGINNLNFSNYDKN